MDGQIPEDIKKQRLHFLSDVAKEARESILKEKIAEGIPVPVLFETYKDGIAYGHTSDFIEVAAPSEYPLHSELRSVTLSHTDGDTCYGKLTN
jgi:tRNA A37 methylthiotransferase MiaB